MVGKHTAVLVGNEIVAAQVRDEDKAAFYADDEIWAHEFCAPGDECGEECTYAE